MIIRSTDELKEICEVASKSNYIAFDTEFSRRKGKYYPIPSLIQFSFDGKNCFICDLQTHEISFNPLIEILVNERIIKVFHSVKQDLDVLYKAFKIKPKNIFDVQIAAMFLGKYDTPSYDVLVMDFLNEKLDKSLQFSDWFSRPLSNDQIIYAAKDVIYLYRLFPEIKDLLGSQKIGWIEDEMKNILNFNHEIQINSIIEKIVISNKKINHLNSKHILILEKLVRFREKFSLENDMIRERVIDTISLQEISNKICEKGFKKSLFRNKKIFEMLKDEMEEIDSIDLSRSNDILKRCLKKRDIIITRNPLIGAVRSLLKESSESSKITASIIATRDDIINLVLDQSITSKFANGWRYEVFGQYVEKLFTS
jgi:ribonuclease D